MTTSTDYALELSDEEVARYRLMAALAAADEADDWASAGVATGAVVADVGCGPGAILEVLAGAVGPSGRAIGVDGDASAVARAEQAVAGHPNATARLGVADATGLQAGTFDVAMCRHVLAHNGGREDAIVSHLASLIRPGGAVYLVDVDMTGVRLLPADPDLDLVERYQTFHARRGNDLTVGLRLGSLLEDVGLEVERYHCVSSVWRVPVGMRGPHWAARDAMVADGVASRDDLARWQAAFERMDRAPKLPWSYVPVFVAIGRRRA